MHTQGPWDVKPDYGKENVYRLWNVDGNYHDDTSPETMDANARLIAAAPELLEALKDLMELRGIIEERCGDAETYRAARAISKAEGKP